MSFFSQFSLVFGALLCLMAFIAFWLFRVSNAPLWMRLVVPTLTIILVCYSSYTVNALLGYPVSTTISGLPNKSELVAIVPHDEEHQVDVWIIDRDLSCVTKSASCLAELETPRAYEIPLDEHTKQALREAQGDLQHGRHVMMTKGHKKGSGGSPGHGKPGEDKDRRTIGDPNGTGQDDSFGVLNPDADSNLPPKD